MFADNGMMPQNVVSPPPASRGGEDGGFFVFMRGLPTRVTEKELREVGIRLFRFMFLVGSIFFPFILPVRLVCRSKM